MSYGKRPLWQWILIYAVVGGIIYFLVYYFVIAKSGGGINYGTVSTNTSSGSGQQQTIPGY